VIIGLDLSLRAAAACAVPVEWGHDLTVVQTGEWGEPLKADATPEQRVKRISGIVEGVVKFCFHASHVFVEEMAFAQSGSHAREVAELTGAVKHRLHRDLGIVAIPVVASHARKVLLQRLPKREVKGYVIANVRRLGGPALAWSADVIDALVVMNLGVELAGGTAMSFAGEDC
jgi:hypothetical protein